MQYHGKENKIDWTGKTRIVQHPVHGKACIVVVAENDQGTPVLNIDAGKLVPDNWVGKRVKVTVELLP